MLHLARFEPFSFGQKRRCRQPGSVPTTYHPHLSEQRAFSSNPPAIVSTCLPFLSNRCCLSRLRLAQSRPSWRQWRLRRQLCVLCKKHCAHGSGFVLHCESASKALQRRRQRCVQLPAGPRVAPSIPQKVYSNRMHWQRIGWQPRLPILLQWRFSLQFYRCSPDGFVPTRHGVRRVQRR